MKQITEKQIADAVREITLDLILERDAKIAPAKAVYQARVDEARKLYPPYDAAGNILHKAEFDAALSASSAAYESILSAAQAEFDQRSLERAPQVLAAIGRKRVIYRAYLRWCEKSEE